MEFAKKLDRLLRQVNDVRFSRLGVPGRDVPFCRRQVDIIPSRQQ
jgi:hypothetical protein